MKRGFTVALVVAAALLVSGCGLADLRVFGPAGAAPVPQERLFDLGVTDFNEDGRLDMFTVNHKFPAAMLENDDGRFRDVTNDVGGNPAPAFPGLEKLTAPPMKEPGVYVYLTDSLENDPGLLHIRTVGTSASGRVGFLTTNLRVIRDAGADIQLGKNSESVRSVDFDAEPGASIVLDPSSVSDVPMAAFFDTPTDPGQIRVGADAVPAESTDFRLTLRDRHAITWADLAGDAAIDAFVVSGGLGGGITQPAFRDELADELLVSDGGALVQTDAAGDWKKGGCRGREAESVDVNGDGLLDLFSSCEERAPKIYRQTGRGSFSKVAAPSVVASSYRWIDLGRGESPSLIAGGTGEISVWRRSGEGWELNQRLGANGAGSVSQIALGDLDTDGDLDALAVAPSGNTMLRNDDGRLRAMSPGWEGVPAASSAAAFVDYDNDGATDLYAIPQGLLRRSDGAFEPTGQLETPRAGFGIVNWADFDDDGLRDPAIAYGRGEFAARMSLRRARNVIPIYGHWLEVELTGPEGNRQAIGAWVEVRDGAFSRIQWVGQNDDAPHSQGHYRLYFGLGHHETLDSLVVHWPDGEETVLPNVPADRVIRLER